jgi:hypothetical protein
MEDEQRPLPPGWARQFDQKSQHQYFVDTKADPPRSIWHHPYDDDQYLNTLSAEERENISRLHRSVSLKDIAAESSDEEGHTPKKAAPTGSGNTSSSHSADQPISGLHKFGRKMKDRLTHSTHEERERDRQQRAEEEQQAYQAHLAFRQAMSRAIQTGQPQYLCKDRSGHDVYIEPPNGPAIPAGARGYNPYAQGPYGDTNARFVRPDYPYSRPYGK